LTSKGSPKTFLFIGEPFSYWTGFELVSMVMNRKIGFLILKNNEFDYLGK